MASLQRPPFDDFGPDFERRWQLTPSADRQAVLAELRDLYAMLERDDARLLARLGVLRSADSDIPVLLPDSPPPRRAEQQHDLFGTASSPVPSTPPAPPRKENPFLPRSVLDRLQASQNRVSAGLRDLIQDQALVDRSYVAPLTPRQAEVERELRLRLGPIVENLIEAQIETLKSELRVRLREEMDRLIAELVRKQG